MMRATLWCALAALALTAACSSPTAPTPTPDAPILTCPSDVTVQSLDGSSRTVTYVTPIAVGGASPVAVYCSPLSGSSFAPGATSVTCTATDYLARSGTCSFAVRVTVPPTLRATRFLAFGDSMTEGTVSGPAPTYLELWTPESYPSQLEPMLTARYVAQTITMTNRGKAGEKASASTGGVWRLPTELQTYSPDAVLLMEGVNDLNTYKEAGIAKASTAMRQMVADAQGAGAYVFLATLPAQRVGGAKASAPEWIVPYNATLTATALQTGSTLVDIYTAIGDPPPTSLIGVDGLHPTEAGYVRIAETFYDRIRATLEIPGVLTDGASYTPLLDRILTDPASYASRTRARGTARRATR